MKPAVLLSVAAALCGAIACVPEAMRASPAPPRALAEIPSEQIQTVMGQLATHLDAIDRTLQEAPSPGIREREQLVHEIDRMLRLVEGLGPDARDPLHPRFAWRMSTLYDDLKLARTSVRANPPEYYVVGTLVGSCTYCHPARR
jgi:hypothetical protein